MADVKKLSVQIADLEVSCQGAFEIFCLVSQLKTYRDITYYESKEIEGQLEEKISEFNKRHSRTFTVDKFMKEFSIWFHEVFGASRFHIYEIGDFLCTLDAKTEPQKLVKNLWILNNELYEVKSIYDDEQSKLLILEENDKERRRFEKLKIKFENDDAVATNNYSRPRIPERVRIQVWRRDGGKCARCGSREKLEYDHIVPISKGGSNTARNIELLCEKCNRSKSNNVV